MFKGMFQPFGEMKSRDYRIMVVVQIACAFLLFQALRSPIIPTPLEIFNSLIGLLGSSDLYDNIISSMGIAVKAMLYSIIITALFVYSSTVPFFKPLGYIVSKFRYLTISGIVFLLNVVTPDRGELKLALLMFGIVPFFVTSFLNVVQSIPSQQVEKSMINRNSPWETLLEVVVVGRLDQLWEVVRQNFAMAWMMITTAEGYDMSGGGIGTMLIHNDRGFKMADTFALVVIVLSLGLAFDWLLNFGRKKIFKYA